MSKSPWNKLALPVKALFIVLPLAVLSYFAVSKGWLKSSEALENQASEKLVDAENLPNGAGKDSGTAGVSNENSAFGYHPEKPVDGKLKGVVEVGASGFNYFVVNIDHQKRWELIAQDFGQSLVYEGLATANDISTGLNKYISAMAEKGVARQDMHFLISSGAQKEPKTKAIATELKKMGFGVKLVSAQQEGECALKCILPESFNASAFVMDVGSGNTKLAWRIGNKIEVLEGPGSKYYEIDLKHEAVNEKLKSMALKIPAQNRNLCFIMGGSPFDLAKQHRNGEERYTVLKGPGDYTANKPKTKAGLNIYQAVKDATGCKTFVFDWDANFAIGYLLELAN